MRELGKNPAEIGPPTVAYNEMGTAQIKAGDSLTGPFHAVSASKTVTGTTAGFTLNGGGHDFLVWITDLGGHDQIRIQTVRAR